MLELQKKYIELRDSLKDAGPVLLAVSGGLDSRFLSFCAAKWEIDAVAVHFTGPHMCAEETHGAVAWLTGLGMPHRVLEVDPLEETAVAANSKERCYHCKKYLFSRAKAAALAEGRALMDGSNASDMQSYRPGLRALRELDVLSPLAQAGLSKDDISALAEDMGMAEPRQPSRPCLLTRFAYGVRPERTLLECIGRAENALREAGLRQLRIRVLEDGSHFLQIDQVEQLYYETNTLRIQNVLKHFGFCSDVRFTQGISGFHDKS
jgi:uncharacterized protein